VTAGQPVEVRLNAYPGEVFRTAVRAAPAALDPATGVAAAWAELANDPGYGPKLRPG
jgi:multidrug resistance efflux pump